MLVRGEEGVRVMRLGQRVRVNGEGVEANGEEVGVIGEEVGVRMEGGARAWEFRVVDEGGAKTRTIRRIGLRPLLVLRSQDLRRSPTAFLLLPPLSRMRSSLAVSSDLVSFASLPHDVRLC